MNSIASLLFTLAALSQVGNTGTPPGVKAGWKIESDGSMSYIGQVTPEIAQQMSTLGKEMALDIPDFLQGRVSRVVWRIGSEEVEREPSEAELKAMPSRQTFPPNSGNGFSPGGLTSLSDRSPAITVPIDSPRPSSMTMPALGLGAARATDNDPTLPPIPSLSQVYPSATARTAQAGNADLYRSGLNNGVSGPSLGIGPASGKDTLPPGTNKPVFGPQPPPPGYTGSSITVNGSSTGTGSQWNDARTGATASQYGTNNPLSNGTFGAPNNYGTNSGNNYGANQNSAYPNASQAYPAIASQPGAQGYPGSNGYPNTNGQLNSATQPGYSNTYGTNAYGVNVNTQVRPDAHLASSNPNYSAPYPPANPQQPAYPPPSQAPQTQPSTWPYPAPASNYAAMPNAGLMPPTIPYVASTQPVPAVPYRNMVNETKRTTSSISNDDVIYQNTSTTPPSYVVALLLASLVGNFYLVMLLNQLLQRYRSLQASSRGSTSLAI